MRKEFESDFELLKRIMARFGEIVMEDRSCRQMDNQKEDDYTNH
jgi:hypothetical protein